MAPYVVMEPPGRAGAGEAVLVRDGFSWLAFFFPPLWLLWNRLWMEALAVFLLLGLLAALAEAAGLGPAGGALGLLVSLFVGLEGNGLRIAALRRRGWLEAGVVEAQTLADGEIRYATAVEDDPQPPLPRIVPHVALGRPIQTGMALGLPHVPGRA